MPIPPKQEHQPSYESTMTRIERTIILIDDGYQAAQEAEAHLLRSLAWFASHQRTGEERIGQIAGASATSSKSG